MPDIQTEIKEALEVQGRAFEEFKTTIKAEVDKAGRETVDAKSKLDKMNEALDKCEAELKRCAKELDEQARKLSAAELEGEKASKISDEVKQFNLDRATLAASSGRSIQPVSAEDYKKYTEAHERWLRSGKDALDADQLKTMYVGSDPAGGYLVLPNTSGRMIVLIRETTPMRQHASIQVIGTGSLQGMKDLGEGDCGWVSERQTRPATNTPELGLWEIPVHEMYAMPEATATLLEDANIDVSGWLAGKTSEKMSRTENTAFVTGNGSGKPRGFADYPTAATADATRSWGTFEHVITGANGAYAAAPAGAHVLIDLVHKPKPNFLANAKWYMNRPTLAETRKLKDSDGNFLWLPAMTAGANSQLLGYQVVSDFTDMATFSTTGALAIAFGDMRQAYQIVDRAGIRTIRDDLTNKPFIRFYTTRRVGGGAVNFEAVKFLKFSA